MKKINKLVLCITLSAFLTGCGQSHANNQTKGRSSELSSEGTQSSQKASSLKPSSSESSSVTEESSQKTTNESAASTNLSSDGTESASTSESSANASTGNASTSSSFFVANANEAIQVLKNHLKEGNDADIQFDPLDEQKKKDSMGFYYLIREESKELLEKGGSGTVGIYRVYDDGSYHLSE